MARSKLLLRAQTAAAAVLPAPLAAAVSVLLQLVLLVLFPSRHAEPEPARKAPQESEIFPTISNYSVDNTKNTANPQQCSTGISTRLLPFKNKQGEIEWAFTDDAAEVDALDVFKIPADKKPNFANYAVDEANLSKDELSPTLSNSSNNDSILSGEKKHKNTTPSTVPSSPDSAHEKDGNVTYHCPDCDATFRIKGYLTRHMKKHASKKAYHCPFHEASIYIDESDVTHRCHPTGEFSRRDTYKTHLKSRHFVYPDGLRAKARQQAAGRCSMCGEQFANAELWSEIHIEGAECKFLPEGFTGKSRIKRRIKKELRRAIKGRTQGHGTPVPSVATSTPQTTGFTGSPTSSVSSGGLYPASHMLMRDHSTGSPSYYPGRSVSPLQQLYLMPEMLTHDVDEYDDEFCLDVDQLSVPRDWFAQSGLQAQHV